MDKSFTINKFCFTTKYIASYVHIVSKSLIIIAGYTHSPNYTSVSPSAFKTFDFIKIRRTRNKIIISRGFLQKNLQKILLCILHTVCKIGVGKKIKTFDFPRDVSSCMNDDESSVRSRAHATAVNKYCQSHLNKSLGELFLLV